MIRFVSFGSIGVGLAIGVAAASAMQANSPEQHPVRFLLASTNNGGPPAVLDVSRMPALRQRLTLDLQGVTIGEALTAISNRAQLVLWYTDDVIATNRRVSLRAEKITVAAALTDVLVDAGVDVVFNRDGTAVIVKRMASVAFVQMGTISGHVTDSTRKGIGGAAIAVEGTRLSTTTAGDGGYTIRGVPAGNQSITARRLGFVRRSQAVTVADNDVTTIDFVLAPAPTMLSEVVTTATGDQRIVELGHVVGRINADSVVKSAPVSSLSELLNGRVPGVQVNTYQGTVGGDVALQVRAPNSINLSTEPIVIVDGVRYTSNAAARVNLGSGNFVEPTSPLNDLNPNEIESIEIAKGPSAATLYGTDAANGVIIVKTKRGRPGPARWNAYVKGGETRIPQIGYPDAYWGWRTIGGAPSLTSFCTLDQVGRGQCTQDSITVMPNPLNNSKLTIFQRAPQWQYGANVSGGSADLRYFFAADLEDATGPVRMPATMADSISSARQLPPEQLKPNALSKVNLRSNITVALGSTAEVQVNVGYSNRATRTLGGGVNNPYSGGAFGGRTPGLPYGSKGPDQLFSRTTTEQVNRIFSSVAGHWSPVSWLLARASGGLDVSSITRSSLVRTGEAPLTLSRTFSTGEVDDDRGRQLASTWEFAATASFSSSRVSSRTSAGVQYVRTLDDILGSSGTGLPPGGSTIGAAANVRSSQNYREQVTLGSYLEQSFGLSQRLFLTGALRRDGASTFGRNYTAAVYPKVGVSWLVSNEPALPRIPMIDELRLRYAFGASGQQPQPGWNRPGYAVQQAVLDGSLANVFTVNSLGNPDLRPEQVREHEFGFDATTLDDRVQLGLTWHGRRTIDQIVSVSLPPGLGNVFTNLGVTTSSGFEAQLSARLFESRALSWEIGFLHSSYVTILRRLGGAVARRSPFGGWVEGYPLGARFQRPLSYTDTNGDGIISILEVKFGDTAVFVGQGTPPRSQTITNTVSLFDRRLRLSALVERRSGFTQVNSGHRAQCASATCRERIDPSTPLSQQADGIAPLALGDYTYIEPGDFTRLREVVVAADLPLAAARALRFSSATVSLQGRNLALWTSYSGEDPESASPRGFNQQEIGIPQGRSWALRFDFGF